MIRFGLLAIAAVAATAVAAATAGPAAAQGNGRQDSETTVVTAKVPTIVRINDVNDITFTEDEIATSFGDQAFSGNLTQNDPVCVWSNAAGSYNLEVTSGNSNEDALTNGNGQTISYDVAWAQDGAVSNYPEDQEVTLGTESQFSSNYNGGPTCTNGPNARLFIELQVDGETPIAPGDYDDTLTLTVSPI